MKYFGLQKIGTNVSSATKDGKIQIPWILVHIAMHCLAFYALLFRFSYYGLALCLATHYLVIGPGISVGYHRMIAHKSFKASTLVEILFTTLGTLAFQGGPLTWSEIHRAHHSFTDKIGDAHSAARGFCWAHYLWLTNRQPNGFSLVRFRKNIKDLAENSTYHFFEKHHLKINISIWAIIFFMLPFQLFLWLVPARIILTWHCTWFINSVAHNTFFLPISTDPKPINSNVLALLTFGEGLHKNHHDSQGRYEFRRQRTDFDPGALMIKLLGVLGVVSLRR